MKAIEREAVESVFTHWIQEHCYDPSGLGYAGSVAADCMGKKIEYMTREQFIESFRKYLHEDADSLVKHFEDSLNDYIEQLEDEDDGG